MDIFTEAQSIITEVFGNVDAKTMNLIYVSAVYIVVIAILIGSVYFVFGKSTRSVKRIISEEARGKLKDLYAKAHKDADFDEDKAIEDIANQASEVIIPKVITRISDPSFNIKFKKPILFLLKAKNIQAIVVKFIKYEAKKFFAE